MNQAAVRDAGVQLPYYYKRNPAKKQDIIQSRPHSKIVWAALRLSYTEKGSTQARPSSHAAMLSAAKLIYGYRGCRFRRLLSLPLLPEVQNRYTFFSVRSLLSIKVWMMRGAVECIILSVKKLYMDITRSEKRATQGTLLENPHRLFQRCLCGGNFGVGFSQLAGTIVCGVIAL